MRPNASRAHSNASLILTLHPLCPPRVGAQNLRGGRVKLQSIMMPEMEFSHPEKGAHLLCLLRLLQAGLGPAGFMLPVMACRWPVATALPLLPLPPPDRGRGRMRSFIHLPCQPNAVAAGEALYAFELALSLEKLNFQVGWDQILA